MENKMIEFDLVKYNALKKRYTQAVAANEKQFSFEGDEYVTGYAKYLLEYLKSKFEPLNNEKGE